MVKRAPLLAALLATVSLALGEEPRLPDVEPAALRFEAALGVSSSYAFKGIDYHAPGEAVTSPSLTAIYSRGDHLFVASLWQNNDEASGDLVDRGATVEYARPGDDWSFATGFSRIDAAALGYVTSEGYASLTRHVPVERGSLDATLEGLQDIDEDTGAVVDVSLDRTLPVGRATLGLGATLGRTLGYGDVPESSYGNVRASAAVPLGDATLSLENTYWLRDDALGEEKNVTTLSLSWSL